MPMGIKAPPWSTAEEIRQHDELLRQLYPPKEPSKTLRWVIAILLSLVIAAVIYGTHH